MFRSATFKLTVYYLAIIAIISIGFSLILYRIGSNDLAFSLHRQMMRISTDFPVFTGSPYLHTGRELTEGTRHLVQRLVLFNILVLAVAGFASYALARRTLRPIEAAHEQQKRFTADVSHELRTPLTALKMESEVALLDSAAPSSALREALASNVEEAEKLTLLIQNLLRLSQLEATETTTAPVAVQLDDVVTAAVTQLEPIAMRRKITLVSKLGATGKVLGDSDTLTQMLVILLDNAIKYSSAQSAVTITTETEQGMAKLSIVDHGIGIPKANLEHVFERFYRADSARTNGTTSGYGLGLSIAKLIADAHGSTISLTSQAGKGTTATVIIPTIAVQKAGNQPKPTRGRRKA